MKTLLAILLLVSPLNAQTYIIVVPTDSVRQFLASEWDATSVERAKFLPLPDSVRGLYTKLHLDEDGEDGG